MAMEREGEKRGEERESSMRGEEQKGGEETEKSSTLSLLRFPLSLSLCSSLDSYYSTLVLSTAPRLGCLAGKQADESREDNSSGLERSGSGPQM
eukprot:scaffold227639_cov30-Tisochrysis_lutea.AAC.1